MKLTRSFAAKAMARAKVPVRTMGFRMLMREKTIKIWRRKAAARKQQRRMTPV